MTSAESVALMLKNYGFQVIDLEQDVPAKPSSAPPGKITPPSSACQRWMTTTMQEMRHVMELGRAEGLDTKIIIGGAVITQEYADEIHTDSYARDARGCGGDQPDAFWVSKGRNGEAPMEMNEKKEAVKGGRREPKEELWDDLPHDSQPDRLWEG